MYHNIEEIYYRYEKEKAMEGTISTVVSGIKKTIHGIIIVIDKLIDTIKKIMLSGTEFLLGKIGKNAIELTDDLSNEVRQRLASITLNRENEYSNIRAVATNYAYQINIAKLIGMEDKVSTSESADNNWYNIEKEFIAKLTEECEILSSKISNFSKNSTTYKSGIKRAVSVTSEYRIKGNKLIQVLSKLKSTLREGKWNTPKDNKLKQDLINMIKFGIKIINIILHSSAKVSTKHTIFEDDYSKEKPIADQNRMKKERS